jgi:hypothetical protein
MAQKESPGVPRRNIDETKVHVFNLDDLIVLNYSERDALLKKADKLARTIIDQELREGEGMRSIKPGSYLFFFPKLTPEAGALRCSVLAAQISREVRKLNPATVALDNQRQQESAEAAPRRSASKRPEQDTDDEMRETASRVLASMTDGDSKDLTLSVGHKAALESLENSYCPVWHARNKLITAYKCGLTRGGNALTEHEIPELLKGDLLDVAAAKIDIALYGRAVKTIQYLLHQGLQALLIVPVHFSTVDRLRFIAPLLQAGAGLPQEAKNLVVFEITNLPADLTRFRLREPVNYLKTRARALIARCGFTPPDLEAFKEFGFHGISVDLRDYDWPESKFLRSFDLFAEAAEKYRLQSFVHSIPSTTLAVAAVTSGFTYMEGKAISEPVSNPSHIRPFEIDMLFEG